MAFTFGIKAYDFAIKDCGCCQLGEGFLQAAERFISILLAGDKRTCAVTDVGQGAEAIMFNLEKPVGIIERCVYKRQLHRIETGKLYHWAILPGYLVESARGVVGGSGVARGIPERSDHDEVDL
jgi:hypothetical protein